MKYTVESGKYLLKNFIYIFPFAIFSALFFSFSTDERAIINVLNAFFSGELSAWTFADLFCAISVLNFGSWRSIVFGIVGIIVTFPCVAMMMALLEKHLRIGKRTFNGIGEKINDNLLSTCGYVVMLLIIYELWSLLAAAILYFVSMISIPAVAYVAIAVFYLLLHLLLLWAISTIYLWLPCMQITGFRAFEALQYSYQLFMPEKWRTIFGQLIVLFVAETLICLCVIFVPNPIVFVLLTTLLYALIIMIYCVRMQIAYFDLDNIERADLNRYYND